MDEALMKYLAAFGKKVQAAALPDDCKHSVAWCLGQLPGLYAKFGQTNESRYGEEITGLVQGVLKQLAAGQKTCPEAQQLGTGITDRLLLLHEEFGIPGLNLKARVAIPSRSRKAG